MIHDVRLTLARPGLASASLEGLIDAEAFAATTPSQVRTPVAAIRAAPDPQAEQIDQLLFGEMFDILEDRGGFAWGQARRDGYVGFVDQNALSTSQAAPTHWVSVRGAFAFAEPSIRSQPFGPLSLNALVTVDDDEGPLAHALGAGWIARTHLTPLGEVLDDPATVAERLLGAPYLWGGRDSQGLDCSGLIQQALFACGQGCPRDADQQMLVGAAIRRESLRRGDLVFWPGHVGMMLDAERLIHANAHHMAVAVEPLEVAAVRIAQTTSGPPAAFRRPCGP